MSWEVQTTSCTPCAHCVTGFHHRKRALREQHCTRLELDQASVERSVSAHDAPDRAA